MDIVRDMKENHCYVAVDYSREQKNFNFYSEKTYVLPDGKIVSVGRERFRAPEILFQPGMVGKESGGIHELMHRSIQSCAIDTRKVFYNNVVLSGGTTLIPGMDDRLQVELSRLSQRRNKVRIVSARKLNRLYATWIGGSIVCSLPSFKQMWVTKREYEEYGPFIIHEKCF